MSSSDGFVLYHYVPSMPAAMVAAAVFGLSIGAHGWQIRRTRTWYMVPLVISLFGESAVHFVQYNYLIMLQSSKSDTSSASFRTVTTRMLYPTSRS